MEQEIIKIVEFEDYINIQKEYIHQEKTNIKKRGYASFSILKSNLSILISLLQEKSLEISEREIRKML